MKISLTKHGDSLLVRLREGLNIQDIQDSKDHLLEALQCHTKIAVDLSAIDDIDTAGIQLLLLAKREAKEQARQCRFENPSEAVKEALELLHLMDLCDGPLIYTH